MPVMMAMIDEYTEREPKSAWVPLEAEPTAAGTKGLYHRIRPVAQCTRHVSDRTVCKGLRGCAVEAPTRQPLVAEARDGDDAHPGVGRLEMDGPPLVDLCAKQLAVGTSKREVW